MRRALPFATGTFLVVATARALTGRDSLTGPATVSLALAFAVPIALAGLAGIWSERSGVVNIGLEGMMIMGTFGAGWAGWHWGPWAAVAAGLVAGAIGGLLLALLTVTLGVDHIIAGTAINLLALGSAKFLAGVVFAGAPGGGQTQSPPMVGALPELDVVWVSQPLESLHQRGWYAVSDAAGVLGGLVTHLSVLTIATVALFGASAFLLWRTPFGLRLRSCGENPWAAATLGVRVLPTRYIAVVASGAMAGLGGAYLAVMSTMYREGLTAGRGFIGLATTIFGNWRPGGTGVGALMFGYIDTVRLIDAGNKDVRGLIVIAAAGFALAVVWHWRTERRISVGFSAAAVAGAAIGLTQTTLPPEVAQSAPYVATLLVLATASQHLRPPRAAGLAYRP